MWKLQCFQVANLKVTHLSVILSSSPQHLHNAHLPLPLVGFCPQGAQCYEKDNKTKQTKPKRLSAGMSVHKELWKLTGASHLEGEEESFLEQKNQT